MFPTQLTDTRAFEIALALPGGFVHHDTRFRDAKARLQCAQAQ